MVIYSTIADDGTVEISGGIFKAATENKFKPGDRLKFFYYDEDVAFCIEPSDHDGCLRRWYWYKIR